MSIIKKNAIFCIASLSMLLVISPIHAQKNIKATRSTKSQVASSPKSIKVVQSTENITITSEDGNEISLPKIEKVVKNKPLSDVAEDLIAHNDISLNGIALLSEELILKKEKQELSKALGITIEDDEYLDLYREAANWLGVRYRLGGMSRQGIDCSGFSKMVYSEVFGKTIDRVSTTIANNLDIVVPVKDLQPGDLVFFATNRRKKKINHVGVYLGDGHFVHASSGKKQVVVSSLLEGFYKNTYRKGGRMK